MANYQYIVKVWCIIHTEHSNRPSLVPYSSSSSENEENDDESEECVLVQEITEGTKTHQLSLTIHLKIIRLLKI